MFARPNGMPNWQNLFDAYNTPSAFLVKIDPEQTYFPKITSRITPSGSMESNPIHLMTPDLDPAIAAKVLRYLPE